MTAKTQIKVDIEARTVHMAMSGIYDEETMRAACQEMKEATKKFRGQEHIYLADMRGMKTPHPQVAALLGEGIGWCRRNGVVFCAHISDDTVQRLQALRLARQAAQNDSQTVDCSTIEEARRVLGEVRDRLLTGGARLTSQEVAAFGAQAR